MSTRLRRGLPNGAGVSFAPGDRLPGRQGEGDGAKKANAHADSTGNNGLMDQLTVRPPQEEELPTVAALRWEWICEKGEIPTISRDDFITSFVQWARLHRSSHRPMIMLRDREVIGMAWLALLPRVPTPHAVDRTSGDVQCVYVVPRERDQGHGGRLITAIVRLARDLGLERVTVHSSDKAIPAYKRHGFASSPRLLQADVATSAR